MNQLLSKVRGWFRIAKQCYHCSLLYYGDGHYCPGLHALAPLDRLKVTYEAAKQAYETALLESLSGLKDEQ